MNFLEMNIYDYDEMFELWSNTEGMGLRSLDDSKEGISKFINRNPNTNFICRIDNKLVGAIMCGNDGRRGYIYHAVVHKDFQRQNIGTLLVEKVIEALDREGIKKVALVVYSNNLNGNEFWKSLGFIDRSDLVYRNLSIDKNNI